MTNAATTVPVTGLGCLSAAGGSVEELTRTLYSGQRRLTWRHRGAIRYPVFQLDGEDVPAGYFSEPECKRCGTLALAAAREALTKADLSPDILQERTVGVCMGTTVGSAMNNEIFYRNFRDGLRPDIRPIRDYLQANPAAMVARGLALTGPCQTITNACSSGSVAIAHGADWIKAGVCDIVLAGGADILCNVIQAGFLSLLIIDSQPCKPFDRNRRGLNLGEGAGVVVLESEESLRKRQGHEIAHLCGYGNASDAYHISAPEPTGRGLKQALAQALEEADLKADDIEFINAHGTGTQENDQVEARVFAEQFPSVPFGSTKGVTGHTLAAAGAIEAVATIICLQERKIPASVGFDDSDADCPGRPVTENTDIQGRYGLSDSAAFGGNNAVLIFQGCRQ